MRKVLFFLTVFIGGQVNSEVHYSMNLLGRSLPAAVNFVGMAAYDGLIWGEYSKEKPIYGFYRVGVRGIGNPTYAGFLQVAPIAPLVIEVQKSATHRFLKIATIDCNVNDCKGKTERTDYSAKLVAAYQKFVFLGNVLWREIQTSESSMPIGLELEYYTVTPGFHRYFETMITAGYQLSENRLAGILSTNGVLSEGTRRNSSLYAVYRFPFEDWLISTGAGTYKSDAPNQDGFSVIFSVSKSWGQKLSLF